jgi:hypothetical protein
VIGCDQRPRTYFNELTLMTGFVRVGVIFTMENSGGGDGGGKGLRDEMITQRIGCDSDNVCCAQPLWR